MSIASIIARGYKGGLKFIATRGYSSGSSAPVVRDTHDAWIPEEAIRKFYENERLKHSKVVKSYKKIIHTEAKTPEIKEAVQEFFQKSGDITKEKLRLIEADKIRLNKLLTDIAAFEAKIAAIQASIEEDDSLLIMLAAIA